MHPCVGQREGHERTLRGTGLRDGASLMEMMIVS